MAAIILHGGAGYHPKEGEERKREVMEQAREEGSRLLEAGGSAVEAVEAAVRILEQSSLFNAGRGGLPTTAGHVEVDAVLMDGRDLSFGAVASVRGVLHAVTLARLVRDKTPHAFLTGEGAFRFAAEHDLTVPEETLISDAVRSRWEKWRKDGQVAPSDRGGDTVGAVAVDRDGHLAAATSTGGTFAKWPGRVGDSPIPGSGAYADDRVGAVSCTGQGEQIMKVCLAGEVIRRMLGGAPVQEACDRAIAYLEGRTGGEAGVIAMDRSGGVGSSWNTKAMPHVWRGDGAGHWTMGRK